MSYFPWLPKLKRSMEDLGDEEFSGRVVLKVKDGEVIEIRKRDSDKEFRTG